MATGFLSKTGESTLADDLTCVPSFIEDFLTNFYIFRFPIVTSSYCGLWLDSWLAGIMGGVGLLKLLEDRLKSEV